MGDIIIISALAKNKTIGKDKDIPWRLSEDFRHFQNQTMGCPCVMGDKTFESLPDNARPLPGRENIVLSLDPEYNAEGAKVFNSIESAMDYLKDKEKVYICGGASIYRLMFKYATALDLTMIHHDIEGDTFFPEFDLNEWEEISREDGEGINKKNGEKLNFSFVFYRRKK